YDIACGGGTIDTACSQLIGSTSDNPAETTHRDALGRTTKVDLPGGFTSQVQYGAPSGGGYDVAFTKDANGNLSQRTIDGDRLVFMDECQTQLTSGAFDSNTPCNGPDRTSYAYYASGELRTVLDPVATKSGNGQNHTLVYDYDTLGRVIQVADP